MKTKVLIVILVLAVIGLGVLFGMKYIESEDGGKKVVSEEGNQDENSVTVVNDERPQEPKSKYTSDTRTIAVTIDNVGSAIPQTGFNDAMLIYEAIVEGGYTRFLAVFKNPTVESIGPSRSARPYFIDYAMENDSIFVHYGGSDKALAEVKSLGINNVNGIESPGKVFWRTNKKSAPHNAIVNVAEVWKYAEKKGYRTKTTQRNVLNYKARGVELENGEEALKVTIPYAHSNVNFRYNEEKKLYERYVGNTVQKDWLSGDVLTAKNIIITFANNYTTDEENGYGRQAIQNIGTLDGYYITEGKAVKIKCKKTSRSARTEYQDLEGKEIEVNDGNTYIQIVPPSMNISFT